MDRNRIRALKVLFDAGINLTLYDFLFSRLYDDVGINEIKSKNLEEWFLIYSDPRKKTNVTQEQVMLFLNYLCIYYPHEIELNGLNYSLKQRYDRRAKLKPPVPEDEETFAIYVFESIS